MNIEGNKDKRKTIRRDPVRLRLKDLLRRNDITLAAASMAMGRNKTYLQQYVDRGVPAVLGYRDSEVLADLLGCAGGELRHETVPKRRPMKRSRPGRRSDFPARLWRPSRRSRWRPGQGRGRSPRSSSPRRRAGTGRRT